MAYYFMVKRQKGEYQPLNIGSSKFFQTIPTYKKACAYTLKEIDDFTMMFINEQELRKHLIEEEILPTSLANKPLSTRCLMNGKYSKVEYDFLYQHDIEYVYVPSRLIKLIMERYYNNEFVFIKKIATNFLRIKECSTTGPEVARLAEASIYQGTRHRYLEEVDQNGDTIVVRMLKLIILKHYERIDGKINYTDEVNYRNLHDLIAFINNYDKKKQTKNIESESKVTNDDTTNQAEITKSQLIERNIQVVTKRRIRKKTYNLDGQISFDI